MAFFSRLKKAKKAADQHKKATEQAAVAEETKPMPAPYKHVPVHAAQDALSATPTRWSPQETRARIAEARKTMSQMPISAPVTANHSRANSEISFPIASVSRSRSDLSIATIMTQPQSSRFSTPINYYRSPVPPMPTIPSQHKPKPSEEQHAFVAPRDAPQPQPRTQRSRYSHRPSHSVSSNTRARSPLSNVSVEEEPDETSSHGSRNSSNSADASSVSSTERPLSRTVSRQGRSGSRQARSNSRQSRSGSRRSQSRFRVPTLPALNFVNHSKRPSLGEISLPYGTSEDLAEKTASNTIPTWRYEDLTMETDPPVFVDSISPSHSRSSSFSRSVFHRRNGSLSVAAY